MLSLYVTCSPQFTYKVHFHNKSTTCQSRYVCERLLIKEKKKKLSKHKLSVSVSSIAGENRPSLLAVTVPAGNNEYFCPTVNSFSSPP